MGSSVIGGVLVAEGSHGVICTYERYGRVPSLRNSATSFLGGGLAPMKRPSSVLGRPGGISVTRIASSSEPKSSRVGVNTMAVARCEGCGHPKGQKDNYTHAHRAFSPPSGEFICAAPECLRPATIIWLTCVEEQQYLRGKRVFRLSGRPGVRVA